MPEKRLKKLTERQLIMCNEYLMNGRIQMKAAEVAGFKNCQKNASKLFKNKNVQKYIKERVKRMENEVEVSYNWKLRKLKRLVDKCAPEEGEDESRFNPNAATSAIAEMNKMQGHYAPEKHANFIATMQVDADIEQVKEVLKELVKKNEKEY